MTERPCSNGTGVVRLTRRGAMTTLAGAGLAMTVPQAAMALGDDPETWLRAALAAAPMPHPGTTLALRRFETADAGYLAVVHMTWPPGKRQQRFTAESPEALLRAILERFRAV